MVRALQGWSQGRWTRGAKPCGACQHLGTQGRLSLPSREYEELSRCCCRATAAAWHWWLPGPNASWMHPAAAAVQHFRTAWSGAWPMQHVSATWQQGMLLGVSKSCSRAACTRRITFGLSEKGTCFSKGIDQPFPTNHRHGWGACARRSRQRVSFPSTHSWLSLIRVPRRGLPPLSRDWSATEAPDGGQGPRCSARHQPRA